MCVFYSNEYFSQIKLGTNFIDVEFISTILTGVFILNITPIVTEDGMSDVPFWIMNAVCQVVIVFTTWTVNIQ
jgi:hypothetical protein